MQLILFMGVRLEYFTFDNQNKTLQTSISTYFPLFGTKQYLNVMLDSTASKIGLTFMCEIGPIPTLYQEMPW